MKKLILLFGLIAGIAAGVLVVLKLLNREQPLPVASPERFNGSDPLSFDESELGGTVSPELLSILVCPEDKGPLTQSADGKWLINQRVSIPHPPGHPGHADRRRSQEPRRKLDRSHSIARLHRSRCTCPESPGARCG